MSLIIEAFKAEAIALRVMEKSLGRILKHSEALELIAKKHGFESWRACIALSAVATPPVEPGVESVELKRFVSPEWNFALEVPQRWNRFPPVSANSPYEVVRFASSEDYNQLLIIFRLPHDPKQTLKSHVDRAQQFLAGKGYGNFITSETKLGAKPALVMNFDKPLGKATLNCRHYYLAEDTLAYALGFGSTQERETFELYERVAKTFEILPQSPL
jgi:hypothetical protein